MTTPDQVLNDLRRLITTAECGDCETPTNTRLACQRAVELIEALMQGRVEVRVEGTVTAGLMPDGVAVRPTTTSSTCDLLCKDRGLFTWLITCADDNLENLGAWWKWDKEAPADLEVIYLGKPSEWTRAGLRSLVKEAARLNPHAHKALLARGLISE